MGAAHQPINKKFILYFRTREDGDFSVEKLDFTPREQKNGLREVQIQHLTITSKEMLSHPQKLEFFIKDGKNKVKRKSEYNQPYSEIQIKSEIKNVIYIKFNV